MGVRLCILKLVHEDDMLIKTPGLENIKTRNIPLGLVVI